MAIKWKSKILLAKLETAYGVDSGPTGAANAILATNVVLSPMEGQDVSRELELPWLAAQATIPAGLFSRITCRVELVGSGDPGVAPAWGPLLRICAVSQTILADSSVTYRPVSEGHESATLHFWVGGTRYVLKGTRGTAVLRLDAQGIAYLELTLTGLFSLPSEEARPMPDLSAFQEPRIVSHANTPVFSIAAQPFVMRNYAFDLGNDVQTRFLVGAEAIVIVDKAEQLTAQVEAVPLTQFDPYQAALDAAPIAFAIQHESASGRTIAISHPATQLQRPSGLQNAQNILEWQLRAIPQPVLGDDQWSLTIT